MEVRKSDGSFLLPLEWAGSMIYECKMLPELERALANSRSTRNGLKGKYFKKSISGLDQSTKKRRASEIENTAVADDTTVHKWDDQPAQQH
jgi:hypothetical protein